MAPCQVKNAQFVIFFYFCVKPPYCPLPLLGHILLKPMFFFKLSFLSLSL